MSVLAKLLTDVSTSRLVLYSFVSLWLSTRQGWVLSSFASTAGSRFTFTFSLWSTQRSEGICWDASGTSFQGHFGHLKWRRSPTCATSWCQRRWSLGWWTVIGACPCWWSCRHYECLPPCQLPDGDGGLATWCWLGRTSLHGQWDHYVVKRGQSNQVSRAGQVGPVSGWLSTLIRQCHLICDPATSRWESITLVNRMWSCNKLTCTVLTRIRARLCVQKVFPNIGVGRPA